MIYNAMMLYMGKISRTFERILIHLRWYLSAAQNKRFITVGKERPIKLVVSMTSFPKRIKYATWTIRSILIQSMKPDYVILWLGNEQFPGKENDLPKSLVELKKYGLEIKWYKDIKSYKKLIPTIQEYGDAIIVTADDDVYYRRDWLRKLYDTYIDYPECICAHRVTKIEIDNNRYKAISGGENIWNCPSYLNKLTGVSGVLYPPKCLWKEVTNEDLFTELCTTNDDIWFWLMGVLEGTRVVPVKRSRNRIPLIIRGSQEVGSLCSINDSGEGLFWRDLYNMLEHYPQLDTVLRKEYQEMSYVGEHGSYEENCLHKDNEYK